MSKVSVIIPAFGRIEELGVAIESVLGQTYPNLEIVVCDDGSNDVTVNSFDDVRIVYCRHLRANANAARNAGINVATGDYVAFLDADDQWLPSHIDSCLEALQTSGADGLYGSIIIRNKAVGTDKAATASQPASGESMANYLLRVGHGAQTSSLFMTRESAKAVLWDESLKRHQDYDFVVRYSKRYRLVVKAKPTVTHNIGHKRPSIDFPSCIRFIEQNKADITPAILKQYTLGMLRAAVVTQADPRIVEYYAHELAAINGKSEDRTINLYLMNIENGTPSGVNRCLDTLITGLQGYPNIKVHTVRFLVNHAAAFFKDDGDGNYTVGYTPATGGLIIDHCPTLYYLMRGVFDGKKNIILHLHTLNLIDFALYVKSQTGARIVSHLHCVPWRGLVNSNTERFCTLYHWWSQGVFDRNLFLVHPAEAKSYGCSDALICVSENGREFVSQTMGKAMSAIAVIPNGLVDTATNGRPAKTPGDTFEILFVGGATPGKGLPYVLKAVEKAQEQGCNIKLLIAGQAPIDALRRTITQNYKAFDVEVLGMLSQEQLSGYYRRADIGVIASLQEQCSYAAIEMAMHGLPLITTNIDGISEMFEDEVSALMIPPVFDRRKGLGIDIDRFANNIVRLVENPNLRADLSRGIRERYEALFLAGRMAEQTVDLYRDVLNGR